jgi:hypothetical protein
MADDLRFAMLDVAEIYHAIALGAMAGSSLRNARKLGLSRRAAQSGGT